MNDNRSLFERLDDISAGQSEILNEISEVKTHVGSSDNRIAELEEELQRIKSKPQISVQGQSNKDTLKQFLRRAVKKWMWFGSRREFNRSKVLAIFSSLLVIALGLVTTVTSSICFRIYSTFTLFENIWMVFNVFCVIYVFKSGWIYEVNTLAANSINKYESDDIGMLFFKSEKRPYKIFRWLAYISIIGNIICIWVLGHDLKLLTTIMEILYLASMVFAFFMNLNHFAQYSIAYVDGHNLVTNERVVLVLPPGAPSLMSEEEFKKKMPFFYQ